MLRRAASEVADGCRNLLYVTGGIESAQRGRLVAGELDEVSDDLLQRTEAVPTGPRTLRMTGLGGSSDTWSIGDGAVGGRSVRSFLWGSEWASRAAASEAFYAGLPGTFTAAALVSEGSAAFWASAGLGGVHGGLELQAGAHLVQVEYGVESDYVGMASEVFLGAESVLLTEADLDPSDGDVAVVGSLDAFVGLAAVGAVAVGPESLQVTAGAEAGIGMGIDVDGGAWFADGLLSIDFGASAFLGVGGGVDLTVELDLAALGGAAMDAVDAATEWLVSLWR